MKIETIEIAGLASALTALRLPFGKEVRSKIENYCETHIPMGKELTKVDFFSYQALRNIVRQRHNHRLPEWHQFVEWVKTLPLAEELILVGLNLTEE